MAIATTDIVGVVLAGGKSTRMGQDKAALRLDGESLLCRAKNVLLDAGCTHVLLSGNRRAEWPNTTVIDQNPNTGPVGGIVSTLLWIKAQMPSATTVIFTPVDTPLLSAETLRFVADQPGENDGCMISNSPLPLVLRMTDATLLQCINIQPALEAGESCSIKRFIQPLRIHTLEATDALKPLLVNINTPTEWEALRDEFENRP